MHRKKFLKSISAAAAFSAVPFSSSGIRTLKSVVKPPRIKPGDTLGLIAPGSFITEKELKECVESFDKLGYKLLPSKNILAKKGYLAGTDEQRINDIHEMFSNNNVKGIICARGGYGCARLLPGLDYNLIADNPKVLSGYSDVTSLLQAVYVQTGITCFHGPVGISTFNDFSVNIFNHVLVNPADSLTMRNEREDEKGEEYDIVTIASGKESGILVGGNLSIFVSLVGTPYDIDTDGKIIFLEETREEPYRIDRMLTQLTQAGKFDNAAGIAMGVFTKCRPQQSFSDSLSLREVLFDRLSKLKIPVVYGMSFGHVKNKFTLPVGIEAELDSAEQTLTLLEPAVL